MLIVCAHETEATPLSAHYKMKREPETPFICYKGENKHLVVAKGGPLDVAAATTWALTSRPTPSHSLCVYLGFVNHCTLPHGSARFAHKVIDHSCQKNWYPQFIAEPPCPTIELHSGADSSSYHSSFHNRGAGAFFSAVSRFTTAEWTHSLQVVGPETKDITATADILDRFRLSLSTCTQNLPTPIGLEEIAPFLQHWHLSVSEQHKLKHLLQRWVTLSGQKLPWEPYWDTLHRLQDSGALVQALERVVNRAPVHLNAKGG